MKRYRKVVMGARLMEVRGRVEADEGVVHVIAADLVDASHLLNRLSDDLLQPAIGHGDHAGPHGPPRPGSAEPFEPPPPGNRDCGFHGHPRDVRVIPKSRDFR